MKKINLTLHDIINHQQASNLIIFLNYINRVNAKNKYTFKLLSVFLRSDVLKMFFAQAVAEIARTRGLSVAAWEDGMYYKGQGPFPREEFKNK